jgi:hypothetical protein
VVTLEEWWPNPNPNWTGVVTLEEWWPNPNPTWTGVVMLEEWMDYIKTQHEDKGPKGGEPWLTTPELIMSLSMLCGLPGR